MLAFFLEARGLCEVQVKELHPDPEWVRPNDEDTVTTRFYEPFCAPRDYAVIARKR